MEVKTTDGVFVNHIKGDDETLHRKLVQPSEDLILERNKQIRQNHAIKDLSFGRQVACIPMNDYEMLCRKYPDLRHGDNDQRQARLMKILNSVDGKKYLLHEKGA